MSEKATITREVKARVARDEKLAAQITGFTDGKSIEERLSAVESAIAALHSQASILDATVASLRYKPGI